MILIRVGYLLWNESPLHVWILWLSSSYIWTFWGKFVKLWVDNYYRSRTGRNQLLQRCKKKNVCQVHVGYNKETWCQIKIYNLSHPWYLKIVGKLTPQKWNAEASLNGFKLWCIHTHHGRLVIAMEDVDEICNSQHTCERHVPIIETHSDQHFTMAMNESLVSPTNLCNLLSHRGAALKPFATSAIKAFFTFGRNKFTVRERIYKQKKK